MKPAKAPKGGFRRGERFPAGVRRLARRYLDAACRELSDNPDTRKAVHETRKSLKKLRALVQLVKPELGREVYGREMRAFRDAGRLLSALRDAEVRLHTFDLLLEHLHLPARPYAEIRRELAAEAVKLADGAAPPKRRVLQRLQLARRRVRDWPLGALRAEHLAEEVRRTYRKGRKALKVSRCAPGDSAAFHAWRKRVKELWYHLRAVSLYLSPSAAEPIAESEAIGELAGEVNDLAVLRMTLQARPSPAAARLIAAIEARLPELQQAALGRGEAFYALPPRDFARRYFRAF